MSVPLSGLALHDTNERVSHARILENYRKQALAELEHIETFRQTQQQQVSSTEMSESSPFTDKLSTLKDSVAPPNTSSASVLPLAGSNPRAPLASATPTPDAGPSRTPAKKKLGKMISRTLRKKKSQVGVPGDRSQEDDDDDYEDIQRAMGSERLERARAAHSGQGGQMPGEDSWDWYQRNLTSLPPIPPLPQSHSGS